MISKRRRWWWRQKSDFLAARTSKMKLCSVKASYVWTYAWWERTSDVTQDCWSPDKWFRLPPMCVCACVSANVSEKIRRMIWRGREKEMCIYVDVFLSLSRRVLFNARMTLWPTVSGFRIFDKIQRSMGVKRRRKRNGVFIFSNKHSRQKKWSCSFIHFNPHSNEMCPSFLISTHRHSLIFQQEHTLSLPAHSFAVHQMMMAIEREK